MATQYGVTLAGFRAKRLADIKAEMEQVYKDTFGNGVNLDPTQPYGQLIGIHSERESLIWSGQEALYNSQYPDTAEGVNLDNVVALTGITRKGKTKSKTNAFLIGTAGTLVPKGSIASVFGNSAARFITDFDYTIAPAVNEQQHLQFSLVPDAGTWAITLGIDETSILQYNDNATAVQAALNALPGITGAVVTGDYTIGFTCTFTGLNGGINYPLMTVTSNTLTSVSIPVTGLFTTINEGAPPEILAALTAETAGPTQAPSGSLTVIETPISGWNSITNPLDAVVGADTESDIALRQRRAITTEQAGSSTTEALRAKLLNTTDVRAALVFENRAMVVVSGRPPKSFECVVQGGLDADIAKVIFDNKPDGIETFGTTTFNITDSQGFVVPIKFSRPTAVDIYLELDLSVTSAFPLDGVNQVKQAIINYGLTLGLGDDVIVYPHLIASLNNIPGIIDIVTKIDRNPSPTVDNNVIIALSEIAAFDTSRITVVIL